MNASEREQRSRSEHVIWHDVECGSYAADLPLWEELAAAAGGPILELGAGTGRVSIALARRGHDVTAVESDPELAAELDRRARSAGLPVRVEVEDAKQLALGRTFATILAPMQFLQIVGGGAARRSLLEVLRAHLDDGGIVALALVERLPLPTSASPPLPDVSERDGWIYSSLPLGVLRRGSTATVERLRQIVSPDGELSEERDEVRLELTPLAEIEGEAAEAGLRRVARRSIEPTEAHVGSEVLILESP